MQQSIINKSILVASIMLLPLTAMAQSVKHYYVDGSVAVGFNHISSNQVVPFPPPNPSMMFDQQFYSYNDKGIYGDFGVRAGRLVQLNPRWSVELGLGVYSSMARKVYGNYSAIVGAGTSYTYRYHINVQRYMFENRFYYQLAHRWSMYYGFGVGIGQISSSGLTFYDSDGNAVPGDAIGQPATVNHQTHAVFSTAFGVDFAVNCKVHVGVGVKQLWLGNNKITVNDGVKPVSVNNGSMRPWQVSAAFSYRF